MTKEELYDKCENMEQLFDKYYLPLQNNWNELKEWLNPNNWEERFLFLETIIEKMEELEDKSE